MRWRPYLRASRGARGQDRAASMGETTRLSRIVGYAIVPALALLLASAAGFLRWQDATARSIDEARAESVRAATASTIAILSYSPDTVQKNLESARDRLAGKFRDSYSSLVRDVVIPGARKKKISAVANVPAAASMSVTVNHATVLVFVNQSIIVGDEAPTSTASNIEVTLDRVGGRWLISQFDPV